MIKLVSDTIDKKDIASLVEWLSQDEIPRLTKGELTVELEKEWAKKIGTKYSVFVNSGSSSILLTLAALKYSEKLRNNKISNNEAVYYKFLYSQINVTKQQITSSMNYNNKRNINRTSYDRKENNICKGETIRRSKSKYKC